MQVFPESKNTLSLARTITIVCLVFLALRVLVGLIGVSYDDGWRFGANAVGYVQEAQLFSDAQGNTIKATTGSTGETELLAVHGIHQITARISDVLVPIAWLGVFFGLYRVLKLVRKGDPFVPEAVRWLRWIAGALFLLPVAIMVSNFINQSAYDSAVDTVGGRMPAPVPNGIATALQHGGAVWETVPVWVFGAALLVLVIAEVFAVGVRNRQDMEGLV